MQRIQVVHVISSMEVGGAQRQILNLFRGLDRERFDLRLVCLTGRGAFADQLSQEGFPVRLVGKGRRIAPGMLWRLTRLLREWRPDIVHCTIFTANLWGRLAALMAGVPCRIAHEQSTVSLGKWYRRLIDRLLAPLSWRVLTVSEDLRRRVIAEEHIAPSRVEVLYNAIDTAAFAAPQPPPDPPLPGVPGRRIGIVGRLEPRKDHRTLIDAARHVVDRLPDATFLLVGEGPERAALESRIAECGLEGRVVLLGERHDVASILQQLDVYVLCSTTEGLSLSILEAMAAGRAVVATRVGGNPELLDEGRAGRLVPPRDPEALAGAIAELIESPETADQLGSVAQRRAREVFDIAAVTRRLASLYEAAHGR